MPPRYTYWTILAGGLPTAFRAAERDDLLPTFHQLKRKHADAELRWFARGRLWTSPEEAKAAAKAPAGPPRGRNWRPGGQHEDPRQRFKDAKKDRNLRARRERFERRSRGTVATARPEGGRPETPAAQRPPKKPTFRGHPADAGARPVGHHRSAQRPGKPRK
jgi:hypothetical protein